MDGGFLRDVPDLGRKRRPQGEPPGAPAAPALRPQEGRSEWGPPEESPLGAWGAGAGAGSDEEDVELPSDTLAAILLLRSQFPKIPSSTVRPFVLKSQLYDVVNDRTEVDRELRALCSRREARMFKLASGPDDFAVVLADDYVQQVRQGAGRAQRRGLGESVVAVFSWFEAGVLPRCDDVSIAQPHLLHLLRAEAEARSGGDGAGEDTGGEGRGSPNSGGKGSAAGEEHVLLLVSAGLLVRQTARPTTLDFAIADVGAAVKSIARGREEVLATVGRKKYKEMLMADLEKKSLRYSGLDWRFHVRDMVGLGMLERVATTVGPLLRVKQGFRGSR